MSKLYYDRSTCRLCNSVNLESALPLAATPIGDKYLPPERKDETLETIPLDLFLCGDCGHLQTGAVVNPEAIYKHYLSRPAAVNPVLSGAYQEYAEDIITRLQPSPNSLIVEIGSNDGAFLNFFKGKGLRVLGVDPAENLAAAATANGVETIPTFFSSELAGEIKQDKGQASVFITNFAYANMDDLDDVTAGIRELLSPGGVFMFETNYRLDVFQKDLLETINHEHLSYFAVKPLQSFFEKRGMELIGVERVPSKGGSIRCTVQHLGGPHPMSPGVEQLIADENAQGLYDVGFYKQCGTHVRSVREELGGILADATAQGKTVAGYGTSIGATIFIYQLQLGETLRFLVDDDPYRQSLVSPGYHIPVVSAQALSEQQPGYVLILAPLYAKQIMEKNQSYLDQGGRFVVVWPQVQVV